MASDTSRGFIEVFDDFIALGTADTEQWEGSSDTGGGTGVVADGTAHRGGRWRLSTDTTDDDMSEGPCSGLAFEIQAGEIHFETRVMVETGAVDSVAINVGLNDDPTDASNTLPIELATATFTSNATTFMGLVYDSDATNDDWHAFWVDDDADTSTGITSLRFTGSGPTADKWQTIRVSAYDRGSGNGAEGRFSIWDANSGNFFQKVFNTTVDRDAVLCTYVGMENRSTVAHNVDVDYVYIKASRPDTA